MTPQEIIRNKKLNAANLIDRLQEGVDSKYSIGREGKGKEIKYYIVVLQQTEIKL